MFNISLQNVKVEELIRVIRNNEDIVIGGELKITTQGPKDEFPSIYYVKVWDIANLTALKKKAGTSEVLEMSGYAYTKKYESKNSVYIQNHERAGEPTICYTTNLVITKFGVKK